MAKLTPIIQALACDEKAARNFCTQIQKLCKGPAPSFEIIAHCLARNPNLKDDREQLAKLASDEQKARPPSRKVKQGKSQQLGELKLHSMSYREWMYGDWEKD